jgi:hypothetical protein
MGIVHSTLRDATTPYQNRWNAFKKMKQLTKFIESNISGKKVLELFILTNVVYILMLTVTIPRTMSHSNGIKLLDMMPTGYDMNYVLIHSGKLDVGLI